MRKLCTLVLLAVVALSLGVTLGLFGPADGDDCSECAGQPCTFLCSSCTCCTGALARIGALNLAGELRALAPAPRPEAVPLSADPRGILHVPKLA